MAPRLTKSEHIVLATLRGMDRHASEEHLAAWGEQVDRFLHSFDTVRTYAPVFQHGPRKATERNLYSALQKLVKAGVVEKSRAEGLGGGMTLYIRREEV